MGSWGGHEPAIKHGEHDRGEGAWARTAVGARASRMANVNGRVMVISFFRGPRKSIGDVPGAVTARRSGCAMRSARVGGGYAKGSEVGEHCGLPLASTTLVGAAVTRALVVHLQPTPFVAASRGPQ